MPRTISDVDEFPVIPSLPTAGFTDDLRPAVEAHNQILQDWYEKINGFLSLGSREAFESEGRAHSGHFNGELIEVTSPVVNADFPVVHTLNRIPLGFLELDQTDPARLHRLAATPAHTSTQLWVRTAAAAGTRYLVWVV